MTQFSDLGLAEPLLRALQHEGYTTPTPIQAKAIPPLLQGRDLLGIAQTGTGKTAAFALPILTHLLADGRRPAPKSARALILAPTRELALQIAASFRAYGRFCGMRVGVVIGGVSPGPQTQMLAAGLDVLVATPGRLLDHMGAGAVRINDTALVTLDEADHMLDLGFLPSIRRIIAKLPKTRQTLFFSATMPREIAGLAAEMLSNPIEVKATPIAATADRVVQEAILVDAGSKPALLLETLRRPGMARAIVFTRTKRGADRVAKHIAAAGVAAAAIHGNKSQNQRQRALDDFKHGRVAALIATDIAARGIDVDGVHLVVNFDLPEVAEAYVHRIGRTARAGAEGLAVSLCAPDERDLLRAIEKLTRQSIPQTNRVAPRGALPLAPPAPLSDAPQRHARDAVANGARPSKWAHRGGGRSSGGPQPAGAPAQHERADAQRPRQGRRRRFNGGSAVGAGAARS